MNVIAPLVVSQQTGNDATASRYGSPYKTLTGAKTAAIAGDTIIVVDGTFNERDLLKDGVNWYFLVGTKVHLARGGDGLDRAIFEDIAGAVTCRIDGYGEFIWEGDNVNLETPGGTSGAVVWLQNAASNVSVRGYSARIGARGNIGQDTYAVFLENCGQFYGSFETLENMANPAAPFAWFDGNFNLYVKTILAGPSSYGVWAKEPSAGSFSNGYIEADLIDSPGYAAVRLDSEVANSQYKLWIRAKEIRGRSGGASVGAIQQSGGKLYLEAEKIDNTSLGGAGAFVRESPAILMTGGEGWVRAQKISTNLNADMLTRHTARAVTANSATDRVTLNSHGLTYSDQVRFGGTTVPGGLTAGQWYYVTSPTVNDFQVSTSFAGPPIDLTSNGTSVTIDTSPWAMYVTITGGRLFLDCQHFERAGDHAAPAFATAGGALHVRGQMMTKVYNGKGIVHSGGTSRFTGLVVDTSTTNKAANRPVEISSPGLVLEQCKLIAPALANSIFASSPKALTCYGVKANRSKNSKVTVRVDQITVNANVV